MTRFELPSAPSAKAGQIERDAFLGRAIEALGSVHESLCGYVPESPAQTLMASAALSALSSSISMLRTLRKLVSEEATK